MASRVGEKIKLRMEGVEAADKKDKSTIEVEAESVAFTVCSHFGIDTSDYSLGYIGGWSSGKELPELKKSMETIRATASKLITDIEGGLKELKLERKPSLKEKLAEKKEQVSAFKTQNSKDKTKESKKEVSL